jgi:perosamine synthetase
VNSATAALHLALDAIGLKTGDEVLVPTMTFAATAEVVTYFGARPVLVDCEPDTLNLDPEHAGHLITPRCRAIIPVHFGGHPCEMAQIVDLAREHRLHVIEDAAHALPAWYRGQIVGTLGDMSCFSFYATKTITTGEGGMLTTEDDTWAERVRSMSLHGISRDAWKRYSAEGSWYYEILRPGYKYNLTDLAASIGIAQLKKHRRFWEARKRIVQRYDHAFAEIPQIIPPARRPDVEHAWHLYVVRLDLDQLTITRGEFIEALRQRRIGTSVHFIPLHLHPFYREAYGYQPADLPTASAAYERIVSLPMFPDMTDDDIEDVVEAVVATIRQHAR